ncbi:type II secretion system protein GspG [Moorellaceae bacterium AZ2]
MLSKLRKPLQGEKGFTLVELMVVVVIIGILVAIVLPQFMKQTDRARIGRVQAELQSMKTLIETWAMDDNGGKAKYPKDEDELAEALLAGGINWGKIKDPWGNSYYYWVSQNQKEFTISSYGPDGHETINNNRNDDIVATESMPPSVGDLYPDYAGDNPTATSGQEQEQ